MCSVKNFRVRQFAGPTLGSNHILPLRSPPAQSGLNSSSSINAKEPPCIPQKLSRRAVFAEYTGAPPLTFVTIWNLNRYERTTSPFV